MFLRRFEQARLSAGRSRNRIMPYPLYIRGLELLDPGVKWAGRAHKASGRRRWNIHLGDLLGLREIRELPEQSVMELNAIQQYDRRFLTGALVRQAAQLCQPYCGHRLSSLAD
jgi:hypothetical protein